MSDPRDDGDVILASISTPAEFAIVFDRHFSRIHGYLQHRVGRDLADDLSSQTFLVAFQKRGRYDASWPSARPWLFGIATNLLRHHRRHEVRELRANSRAGSDTPGEEPDGAEERLDAVRARPRLEAALVGISAEERDVLLLYAWAELSYAEISRALGIPIGTVRSRLSRARGHVRELLGTDGAISGQEPPISKRVDHGRD